MLQISRSEPPASRNVLQITKFLLQIALSMLQIQRETLQIIVCGSPPSVDTQHSTDRMLQLSQYTLQVNPDSQHSILAMLQVASILLQISLDLQQNTRIEPFANEWRPPAQECGHLRIGEMLQVEPVLQQNPGRMLQIREGRSPGRQRSQREDS
jgi:hypothetical protein